MSSRFVAAAVPRASPRWCQRSAPSVSRCGDSRGFRLASTPIRTTRMRRVADGRSASRSRPKRRGRPASTRSVCKPKVTTVRRRGPRPSSSFARVPRLRRTASSCCRPTPTTPTTSGAASASTAVRSRCHSTVRWSTATYAVRRLPTRCPTTAASTAWPTRPTRSITRCSSTSRTSTTPCGVRPRAGTRGSGASFAGPSGRG
jgi:hypothetical protein